MVTKKQGTRQSGKNKGTLKKGYKYTPKGNIVKAKGQTSLSSYGKSKKKMVKVKINPKKKVGYEMKEYRGGKWVVTKSENMPKAKPRTKTRTVKRSSQTGKPSDTPRDKRRSALPPGKRRMANGKIYYETRKNRSDVSSKRRL